ncbi:MAG: hypothetical protein R2681_03140 [Pyrinomonadaceae bacterium]
MKIIPLIFILITIAFPELINSQENAARIVTTDFSPEKCKRADGDENEPVLRHICDGDGGFKAEMVREFRSGVSVAVVFPNGKRKFVDLVGIIPTVSFELGETIKWVFQSPEDVKPSFMVIEYKYIRDLSYFLSGREREIDKARLTSASVVVNIDSDNLCITSVVIDDGSEAADKKLLDKMTQRKCLTPAETARNAAFITKPASDVDIMPVKFLADGKHLVGTGLDASIRVWNLDNRQELTRFYAPGTMGVGISDNGEYIVLSKLFKVEVRELNTGRLKGVFEHPWFFLTAAISPDSSILATGGAGDVVLWNIESVTPVAKLNIFNAGKYLHGGDAIPMAFSPDSTLLITGADEGEIKIWDAKTGAVRTSYEPFERSISYVRFSNDGRKIIVEGTVRKPQNISKSEDSFPTEERVVYVLDSETGQKLKTIKLDILDSFFLTSEDTLIRNFTEYEKNMSSAYWALYTDTGKKIRLPDSMKDVIYSRDGNRIAGIADKKVTVFDLVTQKQVLEIEPEK